MDLSPPQNPLYERYASKEMAGLFSSEHRYGVWRHLWITLADCQRELGLPISEGQIAQLRQVADQIDFDRVAEIEKQTRHDVVSHLRHFAEQAGDAGSILHLGATSAFITDNTDLILLRQGLEILRQRTAAVVAELATFAEETRGIPTLAFTHLQPAQLTTVCSARGSVSKGMKRASSSGARPLWVAATALAIASRTPKKGSRS